MKSAIKFLISTTASSAVTFGVLKGIPLFRRFRLWHAASLVLDDLVEEMREGEPDADAADDPVLYTKLVYSMFSTALNIHDHARKPLPTHEQTIELSHTVHVLHSVLHKPELVHIEAIDGSE